MSCQFIMNVVYYSIPEGPKQCPAVSSSDFLPTPDLIAIEGHPLDTVKSIHMIESVPNTMDLRGDGYYEFSQLSNCIVNIRPFHIRHLFGSHDLLFSKQKLQRVLEGSPLIHRSV